MFPPWISCSNEAIEWLKHKGEDFFKNGDAAQITARVNESGVLGTIGSTVLSTTTQSATATKPWPNGWQSIRILKCSTTTATTNLHHSNLQPVVNYYVTDKWLVLRI